MIIFGSGSKRREIVIDATTHLFVVRSFFHIMFIFTAAWDRKFILAQLVEQGWASRVIDESEAAGLNGGVVPDIHPWWRFSLLGVIGFAAFLGVMSSIF